MVGPPGWSEGVPSSVYFFGDFRLDPARRELLKSNELIDLPSSSFDCLVYLIQHRERAVGRDELISAVWGRADISDNLLSQTLVRVRRALGEAASDRSSIRTVTKFGYRWIAATRAEPVASEPAQAANDPDAPLSSGSVQMLALDSPSAPANDVAAPVEARDTEPPSPAESPTVSRIADARAATLDDTAAPNAEVSRRRPAATATEMDPGGEAMLAASAALPHTPADVEQGLGTDGVSVRPGETVPHDAAAASSHPDAPPASTASPAADRHNATPASVAETAAPVPDVGLRTLYIAPRRSTIATASAAILLAALLVAAALRRAHLPPRSALPGTPAVGNLHVPVLVLPVDVRAGAEWDWLRFGLMDLIANRLRDGGIVTLDSQSVYPLLGANPDLARARPEAELGLNTLSSQRIYASAWLQAQQWHVRLTSVDGTRRIDASGSAMEVTAAARIAADNLLITLGHAPPSLDGAPANLTELLERSNVALLTNRPELARELLAQAPAALRDDVRVQVRAAEVEIRSGQLAAARTRLEPLLPQLTGPGLELVRARALNALALIAAVGATPRDATPLLDESARLAEQFDSAADLARSLQLRALQASAFGQPEDALAQLARARLLFDAAGDPLRVAGAELQAAGTAINIGRHAEALTYLTHAEATFRAFGAPDQLAFAQATQVTLRLALLDNSGALALSDSYWPPSAAINNDRTRHFLAVSRAFALLRNGRLAEADTLFAGVLAAPAAAELARRNATLGGAEVALERGAFARARETALPLAHAALPGEDGASTRYLAWHLAIQALRRGGEAASAHSETAAFSAWAARLDAEDSVSRAVRRDARFYAALDRASDEAAAGDAETALLHYATLFATAQDLEMPQRILDVAVDYVPALIAAGQFDEASTVAGAVAVWMDIDVHAAWVQAQVLRALGHTEAFRQCIERLRALSGERVLPPIELP